MGCGTSPIGAMFVVLISNLFSPIIQFVEDFIYMQFICIKER
jgi:hypothetical protein